MDINQNKLSATCSRLLFALVGFALLQAAGACGPARSEDTGSETHWLSRCNSDLECGEGSCQCGVCSKSCDTNAECGSLGSGDVACVPSASCESGANGSSSATGAVCLLPCDVDADCSELGASATCRSQRCELPERALGDAPSIPLATPAEEGSVETLCDGSEEVRVAYVTSRGFADISQLYYYFAESYGQAFFAIDGQCRFWQGRLADGAVYSGTLSADVAQQLAVEIGLGHVSEHGTFADSESCDDGPGKVLWTAEGRITCSCLCAEKPEASPGWRAAFRAAERASSELFVGGQPLSGPAQLGLTGFRAEFIPEAQLWELDRSPRANELVEVYSMTGSRTLNESSGGRVTDETELFRLRFARTGYQAYVPGAEHTGMVWSNPETQETEYFDMLLRDEVPAAVQAALDAVWAP